MMPNTSSIPITWVETELKNIVSQRKGKKPKILFQHEFENSIPYLDVKAIEKNKFDRYADKESSIVSNGDELFIIWDGSRSGWVGEGVIGAIGSTIMALTPHVINTKYLFYYIQSRFSYVNSKLKGTGIPHVDPDIFWNLKVPIPPSHEQERIVSAIDFYMQKHFNNEKTIDKISSLLKNFKQAILNAAITGDLTKEWRKNNQQIENADRLLEEFRNLRQKKNGRIKFNDDENISQISIPELWAWTRLANIADVNGGVTKGRKLTGKDTIELPYLRVANVQDGYLDLSEIKTIEVLPEDLDRYKLVKGDILFTEGGDRDKLGRGTIWNNEIKDCIHQNHIFRARTNRKYVLPEYISLYTKSEIAKEYFYANASQTINLASINLTALSGVPIALPPIEEQKEIIKKYKELQHFADALQNRYYKIKTKAETLPQSVLAKAFSGQLTSQSENGESASALLEQMLLAKVNFKREQRTRTKNNLNEIEMKEDIQAIIAKRFGKKAFTFSELREQLLSKYEDISSEFFKLVSSENRSSQLTMHFNEKRNCIEFKANK